MKKQISILLFLCMLLPFAADAQVKKVAILETVDKEGNISYAHKLMLRANLSKAIAQAPGYEAYDRTDMDAIMGEQNFQRTGMVSDDQIKRLGEMTGAAYILVAEAVRVDDNNMFITAKILNVETAKTEITDNALMGTTASDIQHGCESLAAKLLGVNMATPMPAARSAQSAPSAMPVLAQTTAPSASAPAASGTVGTLKTFPDGTKGVVFYTDGQGHGLAVSLDQTTLPWENVRRSRDCRNIALLPDEGDPSPYCQPGQGYEQTKAILAQIGSVASAAAWCTAHGEGWYLPSAGEMFHLLKMANQGRERNGAVSRGIVANGGQAITGGWFWCSNENDTDEAFNISQNGGISSEDKTEVLPTRAVRAF